MGDGLAATCLCAEQVSGGAAGEPDGDASWIGCGAQGVAQRQQLFRHSTVGSTKVSVEEVRGHASAAPTLGVNTGLSAVAAAIVDLRARARAADPAAVVSEADQDRRQATRRTGRRIGSRPRRAGLADTTRRPVITHWPTAVTEHADDQRGIRVRPGLDAAPADPAQVRTKSCPGSVPATRPAQAAHPGPFGACVAAVAEAASADPTQMRPQAGAGLASTGLVAQSAMPGHLDASVAAVA